MLPVKHSESVEEGWIIWVSQISVVWHEQILRWIMLLAELHFIKLFSKHYLIVCVFSLTFFLASFSVMDKLAWKTWWLKLHNLLVDLLVASCYS